MRCYADIALTYSEFQLKVHFYIVSCIRVENKLGQAVTEDYESCITRDMHHFLHASDSQ